MTKRRYAEDTSVPVGRSQQQIRDMLKRIDADGFLFGDADGRVMVQFRTHGRVARIVQPLPDDRPQTERMIWRHILLLVTARVTEIQNEMLTFDEAFMPHLMLPDGSTFRDTALPAISQTYETGEMPALMPGGTS